MKLLGLLFAACFASSLVQALEVDQDESVYVLTDSNVKEFLE